MKIRISVITTVAAICAFSVGKLTAFAQVHHRHHGSECVLMLGHDSSDHDCIYVSEGGIANKCTDREITIICPIVAENNTGGYNGDNVEVTGWDGHPSYNVTAQVFAKRTSGWQWTNCGSTIQSYNTGTFGLSNMPLCQDVSWYWDYYGIRITIPRKYNSTMSFVYGYSTYNSI